MFSLEIENWVLLSFCMFFRQSVSVTLGCNMTFQLLYLDKYYQVKAEKSRNMDTIQSVNTKSNIVA